MQHAQSVCVTSSCDLTRVCVDVLICLSSGGMFPTDVYVSAEFFFQQEHTKNYQEKRNILHYHHRLIQKIQF